jgi:hypothetical protein
MLAGFFRHRGNALLATAAVALGVAARSGGGRVHGRAVGAGALLFFASEYGTHRYLFHAPPAANGTVRRFQRRLHYDHHVDPGNPALLFLPPWFFGPNLAIFAALYARVVRRSDVTFSLVLGNVAGLLFYEWTHYVAHVPFRPLTPFGRWIKKYHLRHHFLNEKLWFGVTNPVLDVVAGTYASVAQADRSETTRVLFPGAFSQRSEIHSRQKVNGVED